MVAVFHFLLIDVINELLDFVLSASGARGGGEPLGGLRCDHMFCLGIAKELSLQGLR